MAVYSNPIMRYKNIIIALTISYALFIFYLSSLPSTSISADYGFIHDLYYALKESGMDLIANILVEYKDKFLHLALYTGFGILLNASFRFLYPKYPALLSVIAGGVYGILDEIHQSFVPGRSASYLDLAADFGGLILAQLIVLILIFIYKKKKLNP